MYLKEWLFPSNPCRKYDSHERLFRGLLHLENDAILCVQLKAMNPVKKLVRSYHLPAEMADDILNQSTVIFLRKVGDGSYQFQQHAPTTYLIEIARRLIMAASRSQKSTEPLDKHADIPDIDISHEINRAEATELVSGLLDLLGDPCAQIIRLHHIEGYSDEEVIKQQMTRYTTVDSLKTKRSDCMKKLIQLAQKWKTSNNI